MFKNPAKKKAGHNSATYHSNEGVERAKKKMGQDEEKEIPAAFGGAKERGRPQAQLSSSENTIPVGLTPQFHIKKPTNDVRCVSRRKKK